MAASLFVSMHSRTSAIVLVTAMVAMWTVTTSAAPAVHQRQRRIGRPCSGRHTVYIELPPSTADVDDSVSRQQVRRSVRSVSRLLGALYDDVYRLMRDYATERDVELIGMHVQGMPRYTELHIVTNDSQHVDLPATVANITSKLSRVAVLVSLLRLEEKRHEPRPFDDALETIEDHVEHGLYGILCRLHVIHQLASAINGTIGGGEDLVASVDAALAEVELVNATRAAHRHLRTISIINDLAQLLQHLIVILDHVV